MANKDSKSNGDEKEVYYQPVFIEHGLLLEIVSKSKEDKEEDEKDFLEKTDKEIKETKEFKESTDTV